MRGVSGRSLLPSFVYPAVSAVPCTNHDVTTGPQRRNDGTSMTQRRDLVRSTQGRRNNGTSTIILHWSQSLALGSGFYLGLGATTPPARPEPPSRDAPRPSRAPQPRRPQPGSVPSPPDGFYPGAHTESCSNYFIGGHGAVYDDDVDWATIRPQDNPTTPIDATMVQHGRRGLADDSLSIKCDWPPGNRPAQKESAVMKAEWRSKGAREAWSA